MLTEFLCVPAVRFCLRAGESRYHCALDESPPLPLLLTRTHARPADCTPNVQVKWRGRVAVAQPIVPCFLQRHIHSLSLCLSLDQHRQLIASPFALYLPGGVDWYCFCQSICCLLMLAIAARSERKNTTHCRSQSDSPRGPGMSVRPPQNLP